MGRARSDGYRVDVPHPPLASSLPSSPQLNGSTAVVPLSPRAKATPPPSSPGKPSDTRRPGERTRVHRHMPHRRHKDTGCRNPQVRKGIGSCVFVLGIPCLIAGLILTIVSSTEDGEGDGKYPSSFPVLGPVLLALSVVCFLTGVLLYNVAILKRLRECLGLADKDSLCRRWFPRLCGWLKPDPNAARNRTAISNLQTAPARSALRKMPNPDLAVAVETEEGQGQGDDLRPHGNDLQHHPDPPNQPRRKRAVTFSQGDDDSAEEGRFVVRGVRLNSVTSEPDGCSLQSDSGGGGSSVNGHSPSSSLLSLRNCKIHPKDDVFWTVGEEGGGGGESSVGRGRGESESRRPEKSDSGGGGGSLSDDDDGGRGGGGGSEGGGGGGGGVALTNIDEERV